MMKKTLTGKGLIILTIVAVIGFGTYAFAGWGMGYDHHGPGWHHGGYGYPGTGNMMGNLSDEEIQKMDAQREAFFKSTEDLRQKVYEKELALQSEFAREKPDTKKAASLQKDISELQAQIDQKRIDHIVEMKKINPNAGRRYTDRGGMGNGSSYGGYCWR
jgi:Spy/CpxP family protein refolding chaperone